MNDNHNNTERDDLPERDDENPNGSTLPDLPPSGDGRPRPANSTNPAPEPGLQSYDTEQLEMLLKDAQEVENIRDAADVLHKAVKKKLPPSHIKVLETAVAGTLEQPIAVIAAITKDLSNIVEGFGLVTSPVQAAHALLEKLGPKSSVVWSGSKLYVYEDPQRDEDRYTGGYFEGYSEAELEAHISETFGSTPLGGRKVNRTEIKDRVIASISEPNFFDDAALGINIQNGFAKLDHETKQVVLKKHNRAFKARSLLPVVYSKSANPERFLEAVSRTLDNPSKITALQEALGAILFGVRPAKDSARGMFLLHGPRNSGKSSIIGIVRMLVPDYATSSVSPDEWSNEYHRARLEGVLLNVVTELGNGRIIVGDQLKRIVTGEPVSARHPYGRPFEFTPSAFHLFACNELPRVSDKSSAFERRVLVLGFDRSLEPDEIDGNFMSLMQNELPGIINWAGAGAIRLLEQARFTIPDGHEAAVLTMQHGADPVEHFVHLGIERSEGQAVSTSELRTALKAFSDVRGFDTDHWDDLTHARRLAMRIQEVHGAKRVKNQGVPYYHGIRVKRPTSNNS